MNKIQNAEYESKKTLTGDVSGAMKQRGITALKVLRSEGTSGVSNLHFKGSFKSKYKKVKGQKVWGKIGLTTPDDPHLKVKKKDS